MKNQKSTRKIPPKNYVIAIILFVGIILVSCYLFKWYDVFNNEKITKSYLVTSNVISNEINSIDELQDVFSEAPSEYFLYISYTNDENIYNMEVDLKKVIKKYELQDKFYYFNVDSIKNDDHYIEEINSALNLKNEKVTTVPTILYFKDHEIVDGGVIHKEKNSLLQAGDFEQLLEKMEIEKP